MDSLALGSEEWLFRIHQLIVTSWSKVAAIRGCLENVLIYESLIQRLKFGARVQWGSSFPFL
ncbi:MAG: hypothetical protein AB1898_20000 [Acidobacteriota bacterium]